MKPIFMTKTGIILLAVVLGIGVWRTAPMTKMPQGISEGASANTALLETQPVSESLFGVKALDTLLADVAKGVGAWEEAPFGRVRLVSAFSGIRSRRGVYGAVEIEPKAGAVLKDVRLTLLSADATGRVYMPLPNPENPAQTFYDKKSLFPFLYRLSQTDKPFLMAVRFSGTACFMADCTPYTHDFQMTLGTESGLSTLADAPIIHTLSQTPLPVEETPLAAAVQSLAPGRWRVTLAFPQDPQFVQVYQRSHATPEITAAFLNGTRWEGELVLPNEAGETLPPLLIRTALGWYEVEADKMPPLPPVQPVPESRGVMTFAVALLLLFISLPFWPAVLMPQKTKAYQRHLQNSGAWSMILMAGTGVLSLFLPKAAAVFGGVQSPASVCAGVLALLFFLKNPWVKTWVLALVFWVMPKPYLAPFTVAPLSFWPFFFLLGITGGAALVALGLIIRHQKKIGAFYRMLTPQGRRSMRFCLSLPAWGMLVWAGVAVGVNQATEHAWPLCPTDLETLTEPTLVAYTDDVCYDCARDRLFEIPSMPTIHRCRLPLTDKVKETLNRARAPVYLLTDPRHQKKLILPTPISHFQMMQIMRELSLTQAPNSTD